jgi:hypothetical protein
VLESGQAGFVLTNTLPLPVRLRLQVPELALDSGADLPAQGATTVVMNLAGRSYLNHNPESSQVTVLTSVEARAPAGPVELEAEQGVGVRLAIVSPVLACLSGCARDTVWSPMCADTLTAGLPAELAHIRFSSVLLDLGATSAVGFRSLFEVRIIALDPSGLCAETVFKQVVTPPGTVLHPGVARALAELAPLFDIGPDRLVFSTRLGIVGPGRTEHAAYSTGDLSITTPLRAALTPDTVFKGPWPVRPDSLLHLGADQEFSSGTVFMHVVSHLPFTVTGDLMLWAEQSETLHVLWQTPCSRIDAERGWVIAPGDTTVSVAADADHCRIFTQPSFSAALRVVTPATDTVVLTARDYLQIENSYGVLDLLVKPN